MQTLLKVWAFFVSLLLAFPAFGAARTFVASTGVDNSTCSLVAPCRGFAAAIAVTDVNGEVLVLDSAGYGVLTVTKSVSITAPDGIYAGISVPAGLSGIIVNGASIKVTLRGLTINNTGGNDGILIQNAGDVFIERTVIANAGNNDAGIRVTGANARVFVTDTTVRGGTSTSTGIRIEANATVLVDRSRIEALGTGIAGASDGGRLTVTDSLIARNTGAGITVATLTTGTWDVTVARSTVEGHTNAGVSVGGSFAGTYKAAITDSVLRGNGTGVNAFAAAGATLTVIVGESRSAGNTTGIGCGGTSGAATMVVERNQVVGNTTAGIAQDPPCVIKSMGNNTFQNNGTDVTGLLTGAALL